MDEQDDLYARMERIVDATLRKAQRLKLQLSGPSLPSLDRATAHADHTIPSDTRCWLMDVDRIVASTGRWDEDGHLVHVAAPDIIRGVLVNGERHVTLAERHGISRYQVRVILELAVRGVFMHMAEDGVDYDHHMPTEEAA